MICKRRNETALNDCRSYYVKLLGNVPRALPIFSWNSDSDIRMSVLSILKNLQAASLFSTLSGGRNGEMLEDKLQIKSCKQAWYL